MGYDDEEMSGAVGQIIAVSKEAATKAAECDAQLTEEIDGVTYWRSTTQPVHYELPKRAALELSTLGGLVDYIRADPDGLEPTPEKPLILQVAGPTKVLLLGQPRDDDFHSRECYAVAKHAVGSFAFGQYLEREAFNVALMALFNQGVGHYAAVLALVSNVKDENVVTMKDDGFTQEVVAKGGLSSGAIVGKVEAPNPVTLAPFRSFPEITPVESRFILRFTGGGDKGAVKVALLEADGGGWAMETSRAIAGYLADELDGVEGEKGPIVIVR